MMGGLTIVTRRQDDLNGAVTAQMPIVDVRAWFGVRVGKVGVEIAELTAENTRQQLLLSVAQAFYQALTARSVIDVDENLLRSATRNHDVALTRHVSGVGGRLDVIRARSEIVRVRRELHRRPHLF